MPKTATTVETYGGPMPELPPMRDVMSVNLAEPPEVELIALLPLKLKVQVTEAIALIDRAAKSAEPIPQEHAETVQGILAQLASSDDISVIRARTFIFKLFEELKANGKAIVAA